MFFRATGRLAQSARGNSFCSHLPSLLPPGSRAGARAVDTRPTTRLLITWRLAGNFPYVPVIQRPSVGGWGEACFSL